MTKTLSIALLAGLATTLSGAALADGDAPEKAALCAACHGPNGTQPILPEYPVIGGQYATYLEHVLLEYKSGTRKNAVMNAQAASLSKAEIKALSAYYGAQEGPLYTPSIPGHKVEP